MRVRENECICIYDNDSICECMIARKCLVNARICVSKILYVSVCMRASVCMCVYVKAHQLSFIL